MPSEKVFNKVPGADENTLRVDSDSVGTTQYFCMITSSYGEYSANTQSTIARVEVYSHDHSFGEWSVTVSPSCITAGEEQRTCECGAVEKNVIDAFGHSFGEWVVIRKPTSYTEGERTHTCDICGVVESKSISALGPDTTAENTTEIIESDSESEETSDTVTVTSKEDEKYQPKNVFPWWNAILIFGIVSTVSSAAAAAYFFTKSRKCK